MFLGEVRAGWDRWGLLSLGTWEGGGLVTTESGREREAQREDDIQ